MKKSQIAMLAAAGLILFMLLSLMGLGRFILGKTLDSRTAVSVDMQIHSGEEHL